MNTIIEKLSSWLSVIPSMTLLNVFEVIIIAVVVYVILTWIKNTHAWVLLKGLAIILAFTLFCVILQLDTILWILGKIATVAVMALIVIFQPELRQALERLGSRKMLSGIIPSGDAYSSFDDRTINEITRASFEMSKTKTGALMVIERRESLKEIERTGIQIDGIVSSQLLINIFEHNTPLHDGAVVIRGNIITAATCYLPLSENPTISKELGTRHRAAIGISEVTDSLTVVVSEETGAVSVVEKGKLTRMENSEELKNRLATIKDTNEGHKFLLWKGKNKDERDPDEKPDT